MQLNVAATLVADLCTRRLKSPLHAKIDKEPINYSLSTIYNNDSVNIVNAQDGWIEWMENRISV